MYTTNNMSGKITYEEITYAKNLIKLVKKFIKENDVDSKDDIEGAANILHDLIVRYKDYGSLKNKENFNYIFRERVMSIKIIYGSLLRGEDLLVRTIKNDCETSKEHKNNKVRRMNNISGENRIAINLE